MVRNLKGLCMLCCGSLLLLAVQAQGATTILSENFDSCTTGDYTSQATWTGAGSLGTLQVATGLTYSILDSASTPADPFGGVDNKSAKITDGSTSKNGRINYVLSSVLAQGRVECDLYYQATGSTQAYVDLMGSANFLVRVGFTSAGQAIYINTSGASTNLGLALTADTIYHVQIDFDRADTSAGANGTFTVTIDGTSYGSFGIEKNYDVDTLSLQVGSTGGTNLIGAFDNVLVTVPEPASMALLGIGGLLFGLRRRK